MLFISKKTAGSNQSCGVGVVGSRRFLGRVGVGFLTTRGVGAGFFCLTPTPDLQLDHFLHHTPKLGIPVEMVRFLLKLLLKQISCYAPRLPLILTAKFHSLYVEESEPGVGVGNFGKVRVGVGVGYFTSDSATLVPTNVNLAMVFICKIFQSRLKVGQFKSSRIAFPRSCSRQDDLGIHYACAVLGWNFDQQHTSWETPAIQ